MHHSSAPASVRTVATVNTVLFDLVPSNDIVVQHLQPGEAVFGQGDKARGVYLLYSGEVNLVCSSRTGQEKTLRVAGPGQILGVSAVVANHLHEFSAIAKSPSLLGYICRDSFLRALETNPAIWFSVLNVLSSDVNSVYEDRRALSVR